MLPEFPNARKIMSDLWFKAAFEGMRTGDPMVAMIPKRAQREGKQAQFQDAHGTTNEIAYKNVATQVSFKPQESTGQRLDEFLQIPMEAGKEMAREMGKNLLNELKAITKQTGNVIDAHGAPFDFKHYLDVLDKIWISFDESGQAQLPTAFLSPELHAQAIRSMKGWPEDVALNARMAAIIQRKREEFYAREACRRLVD